MPTRSLRAAVVPILALGLCLGAGLPDARAAEPTPLPRDGSRVEIPSARLGARHRDSRLVAGGFSVEGDPQRRQAADLPPWQGSEPAYFLLQRLSAGGLRLGAGPELPNPAPRPRAVGDRLVLSVDDGIDAPVLRTWEGGLAVSEGLAGASDAVAVRFPSRALAKSPPFRVTSVIVGLDDLHGAVTWPSVEAWLEDAATPLQPRQGSVSATAPLDAVAAGLAPAPPGSSRPTDMQRLSVPLSIDVPDTWLTDGAFDDDFARPDGPLDDGLSDWLECQDAECSSLPSSPMLRLVSGAAKRTTSGHQTLAVKFAAADVEAQRRAVDLDLTASVTIRETDANFRRAGLAVRAIAADTYYRVEYIKAPPTVEVAAVVGGVVNVLNTFAAGPTVGTRRLEVRVTGGSSRVDLAVSLDGTALGVVPDTTHLILGGLVGFSASDATSSGEEWDDLVVERRPDVFAVIAFPAGATAALPIDLSLDSVRSESILVSTDGATFTPRAQGAGCAQPGNPFVQLEVEDSVAGDRLFEREAHVVEVGVSCATCPPAVNACSENRSMVEASPTSLHAGEELVVNVGWWNEHLGDDSLVLTTSVFDTPCDVLVAPVQTGSVIVGADDGQLASGVNLRRAEALRFTPATPGEYCVVVLEQHDSNGDCCPDGAETLPLGGCPGACVATPPSDANPATAFTFRDVRVVPACTPRREDVGRDGPDDANGDTIPDEVNLDGGSLRVAKAGGDAVSLDWDVVDVLVFPARYNVLLMEAGALPAGDCFRVVGPVFDQPSGTLSRVLDMPMPLDGCLWFAVYETDGCGGDASVPDSNSDDIALRCP